MIVEIDKQRERIEVTVPGHSWATGDKAPEIDGWEPYWVTHIGTERTTWTYRPTPAREESHA